MHGEKATLNPKPTPAAGQDARLRHSCRPAVGFGACVWQGKGTLLLPLCAERETEAREGAVVCSKVKQESKRLFHGSSVYPVCPVHSQFLQRSLAPAAEPRTHPWAGSCPISPTSFFPYLSPNGAPVLPTQPYPEAASALQGGNGWGGDGPFISGC